MFIVYDISGTWQNRMTLDYRRWMRAFRYCCVLQIADAAVYKLYSLVEDKLNHLHGISSICIVWWPDVSFFLFFSCDWDCCWAWNVEDFETFHTQNAFSLCCILDYCWRDKETARNEKKKMAVRQIWNIGMPCDLCVNLLFFPASSRTHNLYQWVEIAVEHLLWY